MTTVGVWGSAGARISATVSLRELQAKHSEVLRVHSARNTPPRTVILSPTCRIPLDSSFRTMITLDESSQ